MIYLWEHNPVLSVSDIETTKDIDKADTVIVWNDIYTTERAIVDYGRRRGKKTVVMQHGRRGSSQYYPPFSKEIYADEMWVWGERDKEYLVTAGHPAKKIKVVGSPILKLIKPKLEHKGINIVFSPEHWDRPLKENVAVRDELRKLKEVKITTKLIHSASHTEEYDNPIRTDVHNPDHLPTCMELLRTADLVVGISESTFELIAQAMDIPVVIMEEWEPKAFGGDERYVDYRRIISEGSYKTSLKDLNKTIKEVLKNDTLQEQRKSAVKAEGGYENK